MTRQKEPLFADDLMAEIATEKNVEESFDYIVDHLDNTGVRRHSDADADVREKKKMKRKEALRRHKDAICAKVLRELKDGSFAIKGFTEMEVRDGPKARVVQAPRIPGRVGCHAVMVVVEKYLYPLLIKNTAASIKDRGMHWLHHIVEDDIRALTKSSKVLFYYQCDIRHFYDNIGQDGMMRLLETYFADKVLLRILEGFVRLMPCGLSKGLRSSQCLANMLLNDLDHMMSLIVMMFVTDEGEKRTLYYRYCDDIVMVDEDKKRLWKLRNVLVGELRKLGLEIKPNEAIRPLREGLDYLGYVHFDEYSLIRKRTKTKAARKLRKVKSRKRRQKVIGSFKGMACHADCKNLYFKLTGKKMKKFGEMGIVYRPKDGKKRFPGAVTRLAALQNKEIEVHDFEQDVKTCQGEGRCLVSFVDKQTGLFGKFFTNSEEMKDALVQMSELGEVPFETVIVSETYDRGKVRYRFT